MSAKSRHSNVCKIRNCSFKFKGKQKYFGEGTEKLWEIYTVKDKNTLIGKKMTEFITGNIKSETDFVQFGC